MKYTINQRISRNIVNKNNKLIQNLQKEITCDHSWYKYGYGYKCYKCELYTGLNEGLNSLIKQL